MKHKMRKEALKIKKELFSISIWKSILKIPKSQIIYHFNRDNIIRLNMHYRYQTWLRAQMNLYLSKWLISNTRIECICNRRIFFEIIRRSKGLG